MKALTVFLSIYITLLCCMPCVDLIRDDDALHTEISQNSTTSHNHDMDHCSPFCNCQCCQVNVFIPSIPEVVAVQAVKIFYLESPIDFQNTTFFDFLIPPKA